ncbi:isopentenyl-diphosphate delta-isomerase [Oceanidesulfovibrio indonesiensis]|uniref:Isopentenyl-diphosphate delta-isomerase n=1 Tax=Oceanidesulfovibrio indonesiensis TaxID=54767 RepID=A0A7M3MBS5_9BACT|nr:NUDIX domain-containing protein [Oceanidesulfovibrio indonesiensis]TVM15665.1 isopentenyl-diphosphate delta-isomerase [Oceanidesulfovibrio indonesiensis]
MPDTKKTHRAGAHIGPSHGTLEALFEHSATDNRVELVEVVDETDTPFAVMPLTSAIEQSLFRRAVLVLVYDRQGRLYLQRRSRSKSLYPGRLDLSATGHVRAGESREDAAARELLEELGLSGRRLTLLASVEATHHTSYAFVSLFSAGKVNEEPQPSSDETEGGFFVDAEELAALVQEFREQLTPGMVYFWERGMLFPKP